MRIKPLSPAVEAILREITSYHRDRLQSFEEGARNRRAGKDAKEDFLLGRAILSMATGSLGGPDRELLERCAVLGGVAGGFDQQRVFLPWKLLTRDLTVANAGQAGFLVSTSTGAAADVLRGWSVAINAGITTVDGLVDNLIIPRITTPPTGYALPNEGTAITESQPVIGQASLQPKTLACFCEFSRQLAVQTNAEAVIRMVMLSALGKFLDAQILNGSGAAGELLGIFNTTGVQTESGTALAHAGTTTMKKLSSEAGALDGELAFVSTPAVRQLLENREKATGNGGFVWDADAVADRPAFASNECPSASMLCGPWPQVLLAQWGPPGIGLEINPYEQTKFKQGIIQARMILTCDMGMIQPVAFAKAEVIT